MFLLIYRMLFIVLYPILIVYILFRIVYGKENFKRVKERFGYATHPRPKVKLFWFHAASVGETNSITPFVNLLSKQNKKILLTTGTVTSANLAKRVMPKSVIHQFLPLDNYFVIKKFLAFWQPNVVFWAESELWPEIITQTASKANIILLNARMSEKSFHRWQFFSIIARQVLNKFSMILPQSKLDLTRFAKLGGQNLQYVGNLKYTVPEPDVNKEEFANMNKMCSTKTVIMAASTHYNEEEQIVKIFKYLKTKYSNLLLILAPRHPHRTNSILHDIKKIDNFIIKIRSQKNNISQDTDIYLADTIGEYGLFYRLSSIVFVGGSLIKHGGQNILEPAKLNNAVITGKHTFNFKAIIDEFTQHNAILIANDHQELTSCFDMLLSNNDLCQQYIKRSHNIASKHKNILTQLYKIVDKFCH